MGLLRRGSRWLHETLDADDAESVSITRGGSTTSAVSARVGSTPFEVDDGDGMTLSVEAVDWLIAAAAYRIAGVVTLPAHGDLIRRTLGSTVYVYEVLPMGSEPCFRFSDRDRSRLRIHSKLKTTEAV